MNKKPLIIAVVILVAVAGAGAVIYLKKGGQPYNGNLNNTPSADSNTMPEENGNVSLTDVEENTLVNDDFSINLPTGWVETTPVMGTSATAVNMNESINDPAAQKINFRSYLAVGYDTLQGNSMNDYLQIVKNGLAQIAPDITFAKEQETTINGALAHTMEVEMNQQGVNFKVLIVLVAGKEEDVWAISFNTTKNSWSEYEEVFYKTADSFKLKN